jgi:hypothetical protein
MKQSRAKGAVFFIDLFFLVIFKFKKTKGQRSALAFFL